MTPLRAIELASLCAAALSALALASKVRSHRPIAVALALLIAIDVARLATAGGEGCAWRLDAALCAGWYVVTGAAVVGALSGAWRRTVDLAIPAWALVGIGALEVKGRGGDVEEVWRVVAILSAFLLGPLALAFAFNARRRPWSPGEVVALLLAASSVADLAGPWLRAHPVAAWPVSLLPSTATWLTIAMYQVTLCLPIRLRSSR